MNELHILLSSRLDLFIRVDTQVAFTSQSITEITGLRAFQNSPRSVMWTLKSILLAKLLNAGMNEWLLAPVQLVQLCSASLGVEYFLSQTGAQSTALNRPGNKSTDDFSRGHLFLLKYQASVHETHQYDHSLLFHNKYQATTQNVIKLQNP